MSGLCDSLVAEHEVIERVLDSLESEAIAIVGGNSVDRDYFTNAIDFVRRFADGVHHQKEELVLFPALCEAGMAKESGPVGVMLHEHDEGRAHVRAMEAALAAATEGNPEARELLVRESLAYVGLLRAHIQKENMILFPMADRILDSSRQAEAQRMFGEAEKRNIESSTKHCNWVKSLSAR